MRLQREKGSAGVEFALLLPIIMLLIVGMLEFGVALYDLQIIKNASREGARAGIINDPKPTEADIVAVVEGYLTNATFDPAQAAITVDGEGGMFPNPLTVTVSFPYQFNVLSGLTGGLIGPVNLQGRVIMRHE